MQAGALAGVHLIPKPRSEHLQLRVLTGAVPDHLGNGHGPPSPSPSPFVVGGGCAMIEPSAGTRVPRVQRDSKVRTAENMLLPTQVERHGRLLGRLGGCPVIVTIVTQSTSRPKFSQHVGQPSIGAVFVESATAMSSKHRWRCHTPHPAKTLQQEATPRMTLPPPSLPLQGGRTLGLWISVPRWKDIFTGAWESKRSEACYGVFKASSSPLACMDVA